VHVHVHARDSRFEELAQLELERNRRLFALAQHNGFAVETFDRGDSRWWVVPPEFRNIAGFMVARL
jgi:hypothetical protein